MPAAVSGKGHVVDEVGLEGAEFDGVVEEFLVPNEVLLH